MRHDRRFRQKSKSGEPGGVSPRILSCNHKGPGAYATRLTTSVGNVNSGMDNLENEGNRVRDGG